MILISNDYKRIIKINYWKTKIITLSILQEPTKISKPINAIYK